MKASNHVQGAGLGLRRSMMTGDTVSLPTNADFVEVAPENWIGVGGRYGKQLRAVSESLPVVAHGLSLSIGGMASIDREYILSIRDFIQQHNIRLYSEHLSYTDDGGQLYDLLPLPFTEEAVHYVAGRVRQVQDILGQKLVLENVSYYLSPQPVNQSALSESEFINAVLEVADCELLLDVNNVYVNSVNHDYNDIEFINSMPADRIRYYHVAGHYVEEDGLIIDTHGADVIDPVWRLLSYTYQTKGVRPTLLERDFNIPDSDVLAQELLMISKLQQGVPDEHQTAA